MLYEESIWVGKTILKLNNEIKTLLNLGSSSLVIRTEVQPHMEKFVFSPIREGGIKVVHTDIQNISGVDIVGDFTDTIFVNELKQNKYDAILCSNLFEHLTELNTIVNAINLIVPQNGYLILTVPFHYPYHLDPIDTKYRPRISELQKLFPDFKYVDGNEIEAQRVVIENNKNYFEQNYFEQMKHSPKLFVKLIIRCFFPFYKPKVWFYTVSDLFFMFRPFKVSCLLMIKK